VSGPEAVRSRKSSQTQGGDGLAGLGQHRPHHGGTDAGQDRVDSGVGRRSGATTGDRPLDQPTGQTAPNT
jgi:hypothetical protein